MPIRTMPRHRAISSTFVRPRHDKEGIRRRPLAPYVRDDPRDLIGEPIDGIVEVLHDVTERSEFEAELRNQALHDVLTGLPNRALLLDRGARLLSTAARDHVSVSVLFIDLDNFKLINDGLGHGAGDQLLIAVGKRMTKWMRETDTGVPHRR